MGCAALPNASKVCGACPELVVTTLAVSIAEVNKNRALFETKFKSDLATLLSINAKFLKVTDIVAAEARRRRRQLLSSSSVVVTWYVDESIGTSTAAATKSAGAPAASESSGGGAVIVIIVIVVAVVAAGVAAFALTRKKNVKIEA